MSIKISHSAKEKYIQCPRRYYFHYLAKLRSPKVGSALFFGNALDDAFSRLLMEKKSPLSPEETKLLKLTPEEVFAKGMLNARNDARQVVEVAQSPLADYYTSDFTAELFTPETVQNVQTLEKSFDTIQKISAFHQECKDNLNWRNKKRQRLTNDAFILYNYINWLSLSEKGKLMLEAYSRNIIPKIHSVKAIQKEIEIKSDLDDVITGKIDFIASFEDRPSVDVIMDNKTSSKAYKDDSVQESEQLATYAEAEQNLNAGYAVIQKEVFKKEPKIHSQLIIDTVPEKLLQLTFDNFANVCYDISAAGSDIENYPKNTNSCFSFGKMCPYYQICKHNNYEGLIDCSGKTNE